jgi:hypothetical protein
MSKPSRLDLRNVTVLAVDCVNPRLASRAIDISSQHCDFGDAILFTDQNIECRARIVRTPPISSIAQYNTFILKNVIEHIRTPWVLVVQWDGYVVDPSAWTRDFFLYDYVGARWAKHHNGIAVGNGGFSLRSARLMNLLASDAFPVQDGVNEDELICRVYGKRLETEHGIRFATNEIADRFSYENIVPKGRTFGFHANFNMWRFLDPQQLQEVLEIADRRTFWVSGTVLLLSYMIANDIDRARVTYRTLRRLMSDEDISWVSQSMGWTNEQISSVVQTCRTLAQ